MDEIVVNTSPIIAMIAAMGNLNIFSQLFNKVYVPLAVQQELSVNNNARYGADIFAESNNLVKIKEPVDIPVYLEKKLGAGEAVVIQTAIKQN